MAEAEPLYGDRYRLIKQIGTGGSSDVFQAIDERLGLAVALKVVHADTLRESTLRARLRTEAETMMRLSHPNILQIHAVAEDASWFVMELSPLGSVADRIASDGPMAPREAIRIVLQLLSALAIAHQAGVVHRDVKPANLLLQADGGIKLCDFGIALVDDQTRVTRAGFAMGSLPYMAPEQRVDPTAVGPAADLYSTGATLYHLITASTPVDLFLAAPSSPRFGGIPEGLVELIRKATCAEPAGRYASAEQMEKALARCLNQADTQPLTLPDLATSEVQIRTAIVPDKATPGGVARLEAELHRSWRREDAERQRRAAQLQKRVALGTALLLFVLVLVTAAGVALNDWVLQKERAERLAEFDLNGSWTGTFGTASSNLELRGAQGALSGTVQRSDAGERTLSGTTQDGWVLLIDDAEPPGRYRATVADGGRLDGEYLYQGRAVPFHYVRR